MRNHPNWEEASKLEWRGTAASNADRHEEAANLYEEAERLYREIGTKRALLRAKAAGIWAAGARKRAL